MTDTLKILIIDDNPDDRVLVMRELKREFEDIDFIEVIEAEGFLEALKESDFDLVITDYRIRWTDGLKVLDKIKKEFSDVPVIMFTGTGNEEIVVQAMKGGLDDYVVKTSSHFVRLPAAVRTVLERREEKKALIKAEELYERLFENIPIGLYCVKMNGEIVAVNEAMVNIIGYPDKKELMKVNVGELYSDPKERDRWLELLKKKETIKNYETKLTTYDDSEIWVKTDARVLSDEYGDMILIEGSMEDITDKKIAEMALDSAKTRLEKLHHTGHKLAQCDTEGDIYDLTIKSTKDILNFNSSSILIYDGEDLVIKKSSNEYLPEGTRQSTDRGICGKTFSEKKAFLIDDVREWDEAEPAKAEYRSAVSVPIGDIGVFQVISNEEKYFDENDKILVNILASHVFEAVNRIRYENELKEKEELYRTLFENSGTAIAIIEEDMTASMVNKRTEELTGYSREELVGNKKWTEFVVGEDAEEMMKLHKLRRGKPDTAPFNYSFKFINRYGDTRDMLVNVAMIPGTKKSLISLLDITHNLKTLRAFEESQEMFRITFENATQGIAILDIEGKIMEVNRAFCEFIGFEEKELVNKSLNDLFSDDETERCEKELAEMVEGKRKTCVARPTLITKDGNQIESVLNVSAVMDSQKQIRQILAFVREKRRTYKKE